MKNIFILFHWLIYIPFFAQNETADILLHVNRSNLPPKSEHAPKWFNFFYEENATNINILEKDKEVALWLEEKKKNNPYRKDTRNAVIINKFLKDYGYSPDEKRYYKFYQLWRKNLPQEWITSKNILSPSTVKTVIEDSNKLTYYQNKLHQTKKFSYDSIQKAAISSWELLGPVETWYSVTNGSQKVTKEEQTNVYTIDKAPSDHNIMICSTETGAQFKTTNKGLDWTLLQYDLGPVAFNHTDPNNIIMGSIPFKYSTNGGNTWNPTITANSMANNIALSPNGLFAIAACSNGLWISTDGGINWSKKINSNFHDVMFKPGSSTLAYAITNSGILYKTSNAGVNWSIVSVPYTQTSQDGYLLSESDTPTHIYVGQLMPSGSVNIFRSTNDGVSFSAFGNPSPAQFTQGFYDYVFQVSPTNSNILFVGVTSFYRSTDAGQTWTALGGYVGTHPIHPDLQDLEISGNEVFLANDGGINYSPDHYNNITTTASRSKNIFASDFWGFAQGFQKDIVGGGRYHNGNTSWRDEHGVGNFTLLGGGEAPSGVTALSFPDAIAYLDIAAGNFIPLSTDLDYGYFANFWYYIPQYPFRGHPSYYYLGYRVADVENHPLFNNYIYSSRDNSIIISDNKGEVFTSLKNFGSVVYNIKTSRANPQYIYALTESTGFWKSTDGGLTWLQKNIVVDGKDFKSDGIRTFISVSQSDENTIWIGNYNKGIYKSTNGGDSWTNIGTATLNNFLISGVEHQAGTNGGIYLLGTINNVSKVFYKNDAMADWADFSIKLPIIQTRFGCTKGKMAYMKNKIRVARSAGVWQNDFYEKSLPLAQPTALSGVAYAGKPIPFMDYSILQNYHGNPATWQWTFSPPPSSYQNGTNSTSQNPVVVYNTPGTISVSLKVTDSDGNSSTKTVSNIVTVVNNTNNVNNLYIQIVPTGVSTYTAKNIYFVAPVPAGSEVFLNGENIRISPTILTEGKIKACYVPVNACTN